jgi:hypothetical protein
MVSASASLPGEGVTMDDPATRRELDAVPDALLLAAVSRAVLHRPRPGVGAPLWALLDHLALPRRSAGVRCVRAALGRLESAGQVRRLREHGVAMWSLTASGEGQLERALRTDRVPVLPESPQHAAWRQARATAQRELGRFRSALSEALGECHEMLDRSERPSTEAPGSDAWFQTGARLRHDCRLLGSAWHCLREWPEPPEDRADVDELRGPGDERLAEPELLRLRALRSGRRNTAVWGEAR